MSLLGRRRVRHSLLCHFPLALSLLLPTIALADSATASKAAKSTALNATHVNISDASEGPLANVTGSGEGRSGATVNFSQTLEFHCQRPSGEVVSFKSGTVFKRSSSCSDQSFQIESCDANRTSARSCRASDWSKPATLKAGETASLENAKLTLKDCDDGVCRVDVTQHVRVAEDPEATKTAGQEIIQQQRADDEKNGGSYVVGGVYNLSSSAGFNAAYNGTAQQSTRQAQKTDAGAGRGRIVDGSGKDLGELKTFTTTDCPTTCLQSSSKQVTKQVSCKQETDVQSYQCVNKYATASCITQPVTKDKTCKQTRDVQYGYCEYAWVDHGADPVRKSCSPSSLEDSADTEAWQKRNTYDRSFNAENQLVSWKQAYVKDNGFKTTCDAAHDHACKLVQQSCTGTKQPNHQEINSGIACFQGQATYACRTGGTANSCGEDSGQDRSACKSTKTLSCGDHLALDTKVCHDEIGRILPKYACPASYDHLSASNVCVGRKICPTDYSLNDKGQCVLAGDAYCKKQSYTPDSLGVIDIVSQSFTGPDGQAIDKKAEFDSDNDDFVFSYETKQHKTYCQTGWNFVIKFRIKDIRELHQFILQRAGWNDHQVIYVNDKTLFESPGSCTHGNTGYQTLNVDVKPYLHNGINTLHIRGTGAPSRFLMYSRFVVQRECVFGGSCPTNTSADPTDPASCTAPGTPLNSIAEKYPQGFKNGRNKLVCKLSHRTHNQDSANQFTYDCGQSPSVGSSCKKSELEGYTEGEMFNEKKNDAGKLISWDQVYTRGRHFVSDGACRGTQAGSSCKLVSTKCVDSGPEKTVDGAPVKAECFAHKMTYQCNGAFNAGVCRSDPPPPSCSLSGSHCIATDPDTGECLGTEKDYICKDDIDSTQCGGSPGGQEKCRVSSSGCAQRDQYGNCLATETTQSCYSSDTPRCNTSDQCTYQSQKCVEQKNGICLQVSQLYSCKETETTCEKSAAVCSSGSGKDGLGNGFNAAVSGLSKANAMLKTIRSNGDASNLRIMTGKAVSCTDDLVGKPVAAKCCNRHADASGFFDSCSKEEKDLAAAKRAHRTVFVNRYCSKHINVGITKICVAHRSVYCQFPSLLSRLVQQQGRDQLGSMSKAPRQGPQVQTVSTQYMSTTPGWKRAGTVEGNPFFVYTWDKACQTDPTKAYNEADMSCPSGSEVPTALCVADKCDSGMLGDPNAPNADSGYVFGRYDASGSTGISLGKTAQLAGSCTAVHDTKSGKDSFGACKTTLTSWPAGSGGNAQVSMDISWQLFHPLGNPENWSSSTEKFGRFAFQTYQADPNVDKDGKRIVPDHVPLRVSVDGGAIRTIQVPTKTPPAGFPLQTSPNSRLFGSCDAQLNWCHMTVITQADVGPRPFCEGGDCHKSDLDCRGFTLEEFAVLDFSKMDLGEYTSSLSPKVPSSSAVANQAKQTGQEFKQNYANNQKVSSAGTGQDILQVTPTDGRPPWSAHLTLVGEYPGIDQAVDVTSIRIEWGDGSSTVVHPSGNTPISQEHTYKKGSGFRDFYLTATYYLANGEVKTSRAKLNSWKDNPPSNSSSYGGGSGTAGQYTPSSTPSGQFSSDLPSTKVPDPSSP